jgi:hypothetical protein
MRSRYPLEKLSYYPIDRPTDTMIDLLVELVADHHSRSGHTAGVNECGEPLCAKAQALLQHLPRSAFLERIERERQKAAGDIHGLLDAGQERLDNLEKDNPRLREARQTIRRIQLEQKEIEIMEGLANREEEETDEQ